MEEHRSKDVIPLTDGYPGAHQMLDEAMVSLFQWMTALLAASARYDDRSTLRRYKWELYEAVQLVRSYSLQKRALYASVGGQWPSRELHDKWLRNIAYLDALAERLGRALRKCSGRSPRRRRGRRKIRQRCFR